jgi:hypothetical protein
MNDTYEICRSLSNKCKLDYLTLVQVGDCWEYALEANNKWYYFIFPEFIIGVLYRAITVSIRNVDTGVVYKQTKSY